MTLDESTTFEEFIAHYGRKGMKWGQQIFSKKSSSKESPSKVASRLSDTDLKAAVKRMQLEQQYVQLSEKKSERESSILKTGISVVSKVIGNAGKTAAAAIVTQNILAEAKKRGVTPSS